jgi:uncharacterized membrane-anchored protein
MTQLVSSRAIAVPPGSRYLANKVPEVTIFFWVIKVLCTTVGETFADFLNTNLNLGLTNTTYVIGAILIAVLGLQFYVKRYVPTIYWLAVVLVSIVGTLITDNLTDNFGVSLETTTLVFAMPCRTYMRSSGTVTMPTFGSMVQNG